MRLLPKRCLRLVQFQHKLASITAAVKAYVRNVMVIMVMVFVQQINSETVEMSCNDDAVRSAAARQVAQTLADNDSSDCKTLTCTMTH